MEKIIVSGSSDDQIYIEGSFNEQFDFSESDGATAIGFSDGTLLAINYIEGFWRINRLAPGSATYEKHEATDIITSYTDRVVLIGEIKWVVFGKLKRAS
jgi:hypothetical protein